MTQDTYWQRLFESFLLRQGGYTPCSMQFCTECKEFARRAQNDLSATLNEQQKSLLARYTDQQAELLETLTEDNFKAGLMLGLWLMRESHERE